MGETREVGALTVGAAPALVRNDANRSISVPWAPRYTSRHEVTTQRTREQD